MHFRIYDSCIVWFSPSHLSDSTLRSVPARIIKDACTNVCDRFQRKEKRPLKSFVDRHYVTPSHARCVITFVVIARLYNRITLTTNYVCTTDENATPDRRFRLY